ncbi:MAG: hypothetical protein JO199_08790, partial [Candidatus Eremiobacteraeota bacterium]|nr:hypothetical protein [Candidatus Eremiobacteraeota bacterium]
TNTGIAIEGIGQNGIGLSGSTGDNKTSDEAAGVSGIDYSKSTSNSGVRGISVVGFGVLGRSTSGAGAAGVSDWGDGVSGITLNSTPTGRAGVEGIDFNLHETSKNIGVAGSSTYGTGVQGLSSAGTAVLGISSKSYGVYGETKGSSTSAVIGVATANGAFGVTGSAAGANSSAFNSSTAGSGFVFYARDNGNLVMSIDHLGNVTATSFKCFSSCSTPALRNIEEVGESAIAGGVGYVRFDARVAQELHGARYLVFLTPQGPTQGCLYVAQKTPYGFAVRENAPGRSSATFDYRIVVKN